MEQNSQVTHTTDNKSPAAHKHTEHNAKGVTSKDHPSEVYKQVNAPFRHRHGGTQHASQRAQNHLVLNHNKVTFEHHKASNKELRRSYELESAQYQRICLEEIAPADYVEKKLKASELIDGISPQKGKYEKSKIEVLKIDKETLDDWVPRDPQLIRLVGPHPLNAEPPLITLVKEGLITPNAIHYVRNHGPVPKIKKSEHTIKISGLVDKPKEFTMDEIRKFPSINIPVTLTCDGNRRKELNTIKKSRGFGWGAGGTSCAFWKGALLRDVLIACGVKSSKDGARYVCFDGTERLTKGPYGTSISLSHAMDETNDVMIAYEMNNEELPPDHGFPARLVIPGMVGGRQVKWLHEIRITEKETDNFYHWHDNKVLPPSVDNTEAIEEGWFYDPNFTLYELNINSVISSPAHGTEITLDKLPISPILVEGYAYSGGGRKITRVEVSLDGGKSWSLSEIMYPKSMPRHDFKYWTWCHWMVRIPAWQLMRSTEIVVRAHDASCNVQPSEATWNLLGMMNNSWYRVKIEIHDHPTPINPTQPPVLKFIHPVMPGAIPGGWKIRPADMPLRPRGESWQPNTKFTMKEVAKHNTKDDCWFVFRGYVYNVTSYLHDHPAGPGPLLANAGKDATIPFEMAHGEDVYKYLDQFKIGELEAIEPGDTDGCAWVAGPREIGNVVPLPPSDVALDPSGWLNIKLTKREDISPDTRLFTFKHDKENLPLGIPVGQYILMAAFIDNKLVARPYTPVRPVLKKEDCGEIQFVVKVYFPQGERPGGQMTMLLENMKIGESVKVRGPYGHVFYEGDGNFMIHGTPLYGNKISLVAGGSGITPCYQIIRKVCENPNDNTSVSLVFANKSISDILLKKELDELAKKHKNFKLWYVIDKAPEDQEWKYSTGHIDQKILEEHLFPAGPDSFCFCCGPPAMVEKACLPNLEGMGFDYNNLVEF